MGKVLGIDYGSKRVGLATGDLEFKIAFPRSVLENKGLEYLVSAISDLCEELDVSQIVVGLPLGMEENHRENKILKDVNSFTDALKKNFSIPVHLFDERLSSFEADSFLRDALKNDSKNVLGRDAYAAQVILQRFFDKF